MQEGVLTAGVRRLLRLERKLGQNNHRVGHAHQGADTSTTPFPLPWYSSAELLPFGQVLQDAHDDAIAALVAVPNAASLRVWSASWDKSLCVWE